MDETTKTIKINKALVVVCIAALMFLFFALGDAISIAAEYNKAKALDFSGFKLVFKPGSDVTEELSLGFTRIIGALMLVIPILVIAGNYVDLKLTGKLKENFNLICFVSAIALCIILCIAIPGETKNETPLNSSLAFGGWLYLVLAIAGVIASGGLDKLATKK